MSRMVVQTNQGSLFALISLAQNTSFFVGSAIFNSVYAATVDTYRGIVYFLMMGVQVLVIILLR